MDIKLRINKIIKKITKNNFYTLFKYSYNTFYCHYHTSVLTLQNIYQENSCSFVNDHVLFKLIFIILVRLQSFNRLEGRLFLLLLKKIRIIDKSTVFM